MASAKTLSTGRVDGLMVSLAYDTDAIPHFEAFVRKGIPLIRSLVASIRLRFLIDTEGSL